MQKLIDADLRVTGLRQVLRALDQQQLAWAVVALDADAKVKDQVIPALQAARIPFETIPTMKELGKICGISVGAAVAGVLKFA